MIISEHPKLLATARRFGLFGFLIAYGVVHAGIWVPSRPAEQQRPFDPSESWLLGSQQTLAAGLAISAAVLLIAGGTSLWAQAPWSRTLAVMGLVVSVVLMSLFFNPFFLPIQGLNAGLIVRVLRGRPDQSGLSLPEMGALQSRVLARP